MIVQAKAKRNFEETFEAHVKLTPELRRTDLVCALFPGTYMMYFLSGWRYQLMLASLFIMLV